MANRERSEARKWKDQYDRFERYRKQQEAMFNGKTDSIDRHNSEWQDKKEEIISKLDALAKEPLDEASRIMKRLGYTPSHELEDRPF